MKDYDGKWVISGCEERFDFDEVYDTKGDAIANVHDYCDEQGSEFAFVGQAIRLTFSDLLGLGAVEQLTDSMNDSAFDNAGAEDPVVELTAVQQCRLRLVIVEWMNKHLKPINWYSIASMEEHKK